MGKIMQGFDSLSHISFELMTFLIASYVSLLIVLIFISHSFTVQKNSLISRLIFRLSSEMDESEDGRCSLDPCVFDFRDSDSECEMPVLERQTLDEMRRERDRRIHSKISTSNENLSSEKVSFNLLDFAPLSFLFDKNEPEEEIQVHSLSHRKLSKNKIFICTTVAKGMIFFVKKQNLLFT